MRGRSCSSGKKKTSTKSRMLLCVLDSANFFQHIAVE